jgi:hypothetical protein
LTPIALLAVALIFSRYYSEIRYEAPRPQSMHHPLVVS